MDNNTSYETQAIDLSLLSVLDITKEGKVVSAEKWVELWTLVFQHINKIDAFCVDMQPTLDNWHTAEEALTELIADMQMKYETLSTGFTHYGEAPPQNPHINFWVRRMNDIASYRLLTNADIDISFNPESENAQSGKAVAEAINGIEIPEVDLSGKMDKFGNVTETDNLIEVDLAMETADGSPKPTRFKLGDDAYIERSVLGDLTFHIGEKVFYINVGSKYEGIDFNSMPLRNVATHYDTQDDDVANVGYVNKMCIPERITTTFGSYQGLENNKEYIASNPISNVEFGYSNGSDIICSLIFTTAADGDITINFPDGTKFIGGRPTFSNDETWEFNIKNGVAVGGKVV